MTYLHDSDRQYMIGVDLVCLTTSAFSSQERMGRYAQKILTPFELDLWSHHGKSDKELWTYWALKESAYKIVSRHTRLRKLNPKKFEVKMDGENMAHISSPWKEMYARINQNDLWILTVAATTAAALSHTRSEVFSLSSSIPDDQSAEVRKQIRKKYPHLCPENILPETTFLSISHHGKWGGYAFYQQTDL